jgi:hypothetical protein
MPKFITVLVEGQPELVNVDHIQRVCRVGQESCQLHVGISRSEQVPLDGSILLIDESYEAIVKRITQAHG